MSSANLIALQTAILTNTLSSAQQSALALALGEIIPLFPSVDDTSAAVPSSDQAIAQTWLSPLFAIAAGGGGGSPVVPTFGTLIVPTANALSVTSVTGLQNGQPAIVESYGAEFTLQPIGSLTVDGPTMGTVLTSPDPARVWVRGDTVVSEAALTQTAWHVNRSTGTNENSGLDAAHPLLTKSEIMRRMGSWSPTVTTTRATIDVDSPDTDGTDPWLFTPNFVHGAGWILTAPLPAASFTGSLLAVTAKSRSGNAPLSSTFTTVTGAIAVGMMLVNATRGNSRAFVEHSNGAGSFRLTQPLAPESPPAALSNTEVNTWANGDSITGYALVAIDVAKLGGTTATFDGSFDFSMVLYQAAVFDPSGIGIDQLQVDGRAATAIVECTCARSPYFTPGNNLEIECGNLVVLAAEMVVSATAGDFSASSAAISGGAIATAGTRLGQCRLFNDIILGSSSANLQACTLSDTFHDGVVQVLGGANLVAGVQYGTGTLNSLGSCNYGSEANAVTAFPLTGGLQINSETNAYSNHTPGGVGTATTTNLVALTPAHLDAAAGTTGFGGLAFIPGVGSFTDGSVAP